MSYTLKELQQHIDTLIEQQGEDSVCAAWIYTGEDVYKYSPDGNKLLQQPKELCDTVLKNMYDVDIIHQTIQDAIEQEIDWKLDGVCQMSQNF